MGQVDKRSITLSPEPAAAVDDVVAAGEYASASEVIRDALRQWKDRRDLHCYTVEELRKLVQEGVDSGPALDGPPIIEQLRANILKWPRPKALRSEIPPASSGVDRPRNYRRLHCRTQS
ncbi:MULTISPECIES: type II toxin-antitoxin system ParD family antitoxin [unclassified Mesorhizobium]|uniref:type II toxin-antitoxin system ParD family antitoxin n=1 Tax=unclassified Mesorhizobium TaxID=325217 RepID=UPI001FE03589|nr:MULTISPECIES: type II toxin-antitoxin system ParD family antitoxin [unclassified Mesorhizobium]